MEELPCELIYKIVKYLDDDTQITCLKTTETFHVLTRKELYEEIFYLSERYLSTAKELEDLYDKYFQATDELCSYSYVVTYVYYKYGEHSQKFYGKDEEDKLRKDALQYIINLCYNRSSTLKSFMRYRYQNNVKFNKNNTIIAWITNMHYFKALPEDRLIGDWSHTKKICAACCTS